MGLTVKYEKYRKLSFLDMYIYHFSNSFAIIMYRKPTFTDMSKVHVIHPTYIHTESSQHFHCSSILHFFQTTYLTTLSSLSFPTTTASPNILIIKLSTVNTPLRCRRNCRIFPSLTLVHQASS